MLKNCLFPQALFSLAQSRDPRSGKTNLFPQGLVKEQMEGGVVFSSSVSLLKISPDLLCTFEEKRNLHLDFLMCKWQQRLDFDSNSHASALNN